MYFTGYHGTIRTRGKEILEGKLFRKSISNKEWLGTGIYFYYEYGDAFKWSENIADNEEDITILHVLIDIDENYVLDLDSERGIDYIREVVSFVKKEYYFLLGDSAQENQCTISNIIWNKWPEIQMLIASFLKGYKGEET